MLHENKTDNYLDYMLHVPFFFQEISLFRRKINRTHRAIAQPGIEHYLLTQCNQCTKPRHLTSTFKTIKKWSTQLISTHSTIRCTEISSWAYRFRYQFTSNFGEKVASYILDIFTVFLLRSYNGCVVLGVRKSK